MGEGSIAELFYTDVVDHGEETDDDVQCTCPYHHRAVSRCLRQ